MTESRVAHSTEASVATGPQPRPATASGSSRRVDNDQQPIESPAIGDVRHVTNHAANELAAHTAAGQFLLRSEKDGDRLLPGYGPERPEGLENAPVALSSIAAPGASINSRNDCRNDTGIVEHAQSYTTPPTTPRQVQKGSDEHEQSVGDEGRDGGREHENPGVNQISNGTSTTMAEQVNGTPTPTSGSRIQRRGPPATRLPAPSGLVSEELATTMDIDNNHTAESGLLDESCRGT
ncbi:uncharacterized protein B0I36DRAFT_166999 [Microdochium trichocladiopsis]|uniref:Uncharacterized protein n=1 Tax=Microdochium trichocladiopsis TaxID=1682393 RepID=A0A9P8XXS1_9PEZI|nr:uncharacterized protein B0I36DRAFT_166999 [Microdochium trichocladiopsis]KAH7025229.1 hypothetical protein B0I36DRAFT_166999 [Microdochium trichocladiopsis]